MKNIKELPRTGKMEVSEEQYKVLFEGLISMGYAPVSESYKEKYYSFVFWMPMSIAVSNNKSLFDRSFEPEILFDVYFN